MKNRITIYSVVLLSALTGYLIGNNGNLSFLELKDENSIKRLERLINYIQKDYVDKIDTDSLVGAVIEDTVNKLDPHSVYIPNSDRQVINENMQGNFSGIGVSFFMAGDSVTIIRVLKDGPSQKAGLLAGDRILIADQDTLFNKSLNSSKIMNILKGSPGTPVNLTIYRKSENLTINFNLIRGKVPLPSVESSYMINEKVGYIKINRFSQTTFDEFELAMKKLIKVGMSKIILDLRNNPGGYLHPAKQISNTFLNKGQKIVITKTNSGNQENTYAKGNGIFQKGEIIILVNEESASASEIVAGAIQDNDRGWIIGRRTFGKGLVQQQMPLGRGDVVRLTTAKYFTPTGRSIQRPYENGREDYYNELNRRFENGEMADENKIPTGDSLAYKTPNGRIVYGGGGITPDIYISNLNTKEEQWNDLILKSSLINNFVFNEIDKKRKKFSELKEIDLFGNKKLNILPTYVSFQKFCKKNKVDFTKDEDETMKAIKANLALQLFGENSYHKIKNQGDKFLSKAIQTLDSTSN